MIRYRARGFTLIELVTASALFLMFIGLTTLEIASVARTSRAITRGSAELISATRFAERFRDDVRQAQSVGVQSDGQCVILGGKEKGIQYRLSPEMRLERVSGSGEISSGPYLQAVFFSVDTTPSASDRRTILHARWDCLAETDPLQEKSDPARAVPRVLTLDTALRAEREPQQ
jgi:prepilin-type N-terminal cleavage/methylation domain-containing protein